MKYLYCNGDSWTYGEEIITENFQLHTNEKYYNTWPWFLSQELDIPVCVNEATGGGSNDRIYRKTTDFIRKYIKSGKDPKELMIVIGWTTPERTEISVEDVNGSPKYVRLTIQNPVDIDGDFDNPTRKIIDGFHNLYYRLYNDINGIEKQIHHMSQLRLLCEGYGITYYDFTAIGIWPPHIIEKSDKMGIELKNYYSTHSFVNVVVDKNWDVYEFKHPKPETYKKWAKVLKNFIQR
jgi:hypothetical protein